MKTKNTLRVTTSVIFSLLLAACGDSSSDDVPAVKPPAEQPQYDNIHLKASPNAQLDDSLSVYFGAWYPCSTLHPEMCIDPSKATPIENYSVENRNNKLTQQPSLDEFRVTATELNRFAEESELVPMRPELFAKGQYSVMDVLLYLSETRDDFHVELGEFDSGIETYPFTVSFDRNRDGQFTEDDGDENYQSPDWYVSFMYSDGDWKRMVGQPAQEPLYARLDEFVVRNDMHLRLRPFDPSMTERRQQIQRAEVTRLAEYGGKVVLPKILVDHDDGRGPQVIATDVEVTPHDLRLDLFQPGVLTLTDAIMSAHEQGQGEFEFTFWPTLATGVNVGSYAMTSINGRRAAGLFGWDYKSGELSSNHDFFWTPFYPSAQMLVMADQRFDPNDPENPMNMLAHKCSWLSGGQHTLQTAQICIDNWYGTFGGNNIHQMTDMAVLRLPREAILFSWNSHMTAMFEVSQQNHAQDGRYEVYDIARAVAPLTQAHFGWGIADCGSCHSMDNIHLTGNAPQLPENTEPYYCASCHGSNGAPKGHGEQARCFWCHSEDQVMVNHGEASTKQRVTELGCSGSTIHGQTLDGQRAPCADLVSQQRPFMAPHDRADNLNSYTQLVPNLTSVGNSDWNTSKRFPDPYSCVTCHPAN